MADFPQPKYDPNKNGGLNIAASVGDGYSVLLKWDRAFPSVFGYTTSYNIYYSTIREDVFTEGVKFVSVPDGYTQGCILELTPGETYYFAVRGTQYSPEWANLNLLQDGFPDLKSYTEGILLSDLAQDGAEIEVSDIELWPAFGVIQVGSEWIRYTSKDLGNNTLLGLTRGFLSTNQRFHQTDGYDGVSFKDPVIRFWPGLEDDNTIVQLETVGFSHPNYAYTLTDGYAIQNDIVTTNTAGDASDNQIGDAPRYDGVGWHRTDPLRLLNGECIGTYYGGEQWCADGYSGVGRQTRGVSFEDQILRREEFLLERFAGEPVVLVKRLYEGIRCSCVKASQEQPLHRCHTCFAPGTLVRTESGYKPIENIQVGEKVLTASGNYHKVKQVMINPFDGYLKSINSSVSTNPILSTPDHPFLCLSGNHRSLIKRSCGPTCNAYIQNGDGLVSRRPDVRQLPSGNWHARVTHNGKRVVLGTFKTESEGIRAVTNYKKNYKKGHYLDWKSAQDIDEKDWLVANFNREINEIKKISVPFDFRKATKLGSERLGVNTFEVNKKFLWIIGIYLAEGSSSKRTVVFSLHKDEVEYQEKIVNFFEKLGYNSSVSYTDGYECVVNVHSTTLASWFKEWLGQYCFEKKIPNELMSLKPELQMSLVQGLWDGDGSKTINEFEITQTSEILALQISEILHRNNKQPLVRKYQSNILTPNGNKRRPAYTVSWEADDFHHENRKYRWNFENNKLVQIKNVNRKYYQGPVYNLEVEEDHTYVVNGIIVHNCFGTGFVTGYEQFYNPRRSDSRIMVRFDPTAEDIKLLDAGLENEFLPNCWTTAFPRLNDRDFLIRFDIENQEEYRYEILNVTRNTVFQGQSGAQKFSARRVRKTEPIYQWRSFRDTSTMPMTANTTVGLLRGVNGAFIPHTHEIVVNEGILALSQVNQTTSVVQDHNHDIVNGVVQEVLGHSHEIILP